MVRVSGAIERLAAAPGWNPAGILTHSALTQAREVPSMNRSRGTPRHPSRRGFFHRTAQAVAGFAFPTIIPGSALGLGGRVAPSNRITLGIIGTGNQGFNDIHSFLRDERVQIVAVCDVHREGPGYWQGKIGGREPARRLVEEHYAKARPGGTFRGCDACVDYREVLGRADIDALEVCTPDHWHAIPVIEACRARKDIYCQKPHSGPTQWADSTSPVGGMTHVGSGHATPAARSARRRARVVGFAPFWQDAVEVRGCCRRTVVERDTEARTGEWASRPVRSSGSAH